MEFPPVLVIKDILISLFPVSDPKRKRGLPHQRRCHYALSAYHANIADMESVCTAGSASLHRHGFCQVARLIHIVAVERRDIIREELEGENGKDWLQLLA